MPCQYSLGFLHFHKARLSVLCLTHQNTMLKPLMQRAQKLKQEDPNLCFTKTCHLCYLTAMAVLCSVTQSCPTLCNPMDCSQPGSSVHGMLQARILECIAMPSRRSSKPRDQTQSPILQVDSLLSEPPGKHNGNSSKK